MSAKRKDQCRLQPPLPPLHAVMTHRRGIRPGSLAKSAGFLFHDRVITAVLLNAVLPGAGHAALGRWLAALGWFAATIGSYAGGMIVLVYAALNLPGFDRFWRLGELRLFAFFLLP